MSEYPKIDRLRKRVDENMTITLNQACYIIWAELCVCSNVYLDFKDWCKENKVENKRFVWPIWKGIFATYKPFSEKRLRVKLDQVIASYEATRNYQ